MTRVLALTTFSISRTGFYHDAGRVEQRAQRSGVRERARGGSRRQTGSRGDDGDAPAAGRVRERARGARARDAAKLFDETERAVSELSRARLHVDHAIAVDAPEPRHARGRQRIEDELGRGARLEPR